MKLFPFFCILVVFSVAAPVIAEIPLMSTGNLLVVGNYNVNQGSSDLGAVIQ